MIQPPVELAQTDIFAPRFGLNEIRPLVDLRGANVKDEAWLVHVANALKQSSSADEDGITWAGYNSLLANYVLVKPPAVIGVYPLFPDKAASASSMTHAMELPMQGIEFLNPGQTSVSGADQPLYAIISLSNGNFPTHWEKTSWLLLLARCTSKTICI